MGLEVLLVGVEHAVEPGKELSGAVVSVDDDGDAVDGGDGSDELGGSNGTLDGGLLVLVVDTLAGKVGGTTLGHLDDDGGLVVSGSLEDGDNGGRGGHVDGGEGKLVLSSILEELGLVCAGWSVRDGADAISRVVALRARRNCPRQ